MPLKLWWYTASPEEHLQMCYVKYFLFATLQINIFMLLAGAAGLILWQFLKVSELGNF